MNDIQEYTVPKLLSNTFAMKLLIALLTQWTGPLKWM